MIVAHEGQHAAQRRGSRQIGVAEHVAAAVDARTLAVPEAEHAVETALAAHLGLLRAPDAGRRQFLVEAGFEVDVVRLEQLGESHELQVEPAHRRAAIARDEAAGVVAGAPVALLLRNQQSGDRLRAIQQHGGFAEVEPVGELDLRERDLRGLLGQRRHCAFDHGLHPVRRSGHDSDFSRRGRRGAGAAAECALKCQP